MTLIPTLSSVWTLLLSGCALFWCSMVVLAVQLF